MITRLPTALALALVACSSASSTPPTASTAREGSEAREEPAEAAESPREAAAEPPVASPARDERLAAADEHVASRRWADAASAYRAILDDSDAPEALQQDARLGLVGGWLAREDADPAGPLCRRDAPPATPGSAARTVAVPDVLGARYEARSLLRCARDAARPDDEATLTALTERVEALDARDRTECGAQGARAFIDGYALLGTSSGCAPSRSMFGTSALDQRMGLDRPAPSILDGLR